MPSIDRDSSTPFYQQVYEQISRGIESGFYPSGKKLPSIRECAHALGVSNTTIELAYQKLVEEGYVESRRGSGYTICSLRTPLTDPYRSFSDEYRMSLEELVSESSSDNSESRILYDFSYDAVDPGTFPYISWARICREVYFDKGAEGACLYNDPQGLFALRAEIAKYLGGEYGLNCTAEQILVKATTRELVSEIMALFEPAKTKFAMEAPGYDEVSRRLKERGFALTPISTYPYPSWDEMEKDLDGVDVAFLTPASQFPSNHPMPIETRKKVVEWAVENDAYIIDDEYGWEFQLGMSRAPALASLDGFGHVITLGTFSNSFTPAVCLSYAVLPPQLMLEWRASRKGTHPQVPWQTQAAMASFMREDNWRIHMRKMRTSARRKHELLIKALTDSMGGGIEVVDSECSLYVLVRTTDDRDESELIDAAAEAGIRVYPTSQYWVEGAPSDWCYVLIGYAGISAEAIVEGIRKLAAAWGF